MQLTLVSFPTCPFVQRAMIVLHHRGADFQTRYVDLLDKPPWLFEISPRGKVPVLLADEVPLFESQAICEFLDETLPGESLMPTEPVQRARDRALFALAGEDLFPAVYRMMHARSAKAFAELGERLEEALARVEPMLTGRAWLSGDGTRFGLADVAVAPAFTRLALLEELGAWSLPASLPRLRDWSRRVLALDAVRRSVPEDFVERSLSAMRAKDAWAMSRSG